MSLATQLFEKATPNSPINSSEESVILLKNKSKIIALDNIIKNPKNRKIDYIKVHELVSSIREIGLLDEPVVTPQPDGFYMLLSGEHRVTALRNLAKENPEFENVRCKVMDAGDELNCELALLDGNIHNPLSAYELMMSIGRKEEILKEKKVRGTLRNTIASGTFLGPTQVGTYLRIYKQATPEVKKALKDELITIDKAAKLSLLPTSEQVYGLKDVKQNNIVHDSRMKFEKDVKKACVALDKLLQTNCGDFEAIREEVSCIKTKISNLLKR